MTLRNLKDTSYTTLHGDRILQHQGMAKASLEKVWLAFTTKEGLQNGMAPVIEIDFKVSGFIKMHYEQTANIGDPGTSGAIIVGFIPMELILYKTDFSHSFHSNPKPTQKPRKIGYLIVLRLLETFLISNSGYQIRYTLLEPKNTNSKLLKMDDQQAELY